MFFVHSFLGVINENIGGYLIPIQLFMIWVNVAVCVRRSHDIGNSGWWIFVPLYQLYLIFKGGDMGPNEYGEDPKNKDIQP